MLPQWTIWIWGSRPRLTILRATVLGLVLYLLGRFVCPPLHVVGRSMEPTIHDGAWRMGNLLKFNSRNPQRGDVIVIRLVGHHAYYLKRVLGLPGETIAFQQGALLVNGRAVPESYLSTNSEWNMPPVCIPSDEYFVVGDNRAVPLREQLAGLTRRLDIAGGLLW
jgi:signal peptidase I